MHRDGRDGLLILVIGDEDSPPRVPHNGHHAARVRIKVAFAGEAHDLLNDGQIKATHAGTMTQILGPDNLCLGWCHGRTPHRTAIAAAELALQRMGGSVVPPHASRLRAGEALAPATRWRC